MDKIDSGEIEDGDLEIIMTAIGGQQSSKIQAESVHAGALYKDNEIWKHFDPSRSKEALDIASASSLHGSYTSILGWLKAHSKDKIKIPQTTDVLPYFDNNQVIGRKWRVKNDFKTESSVITSVAHMQPRSDIWTKE